jgi:hypothetical protein
MNIQVIAPSGKLTNMQMELLKIFSEDMPDEQVVEIKLLLSNYFANKAMDEFDKLEKSNGWTKETYAKWTDEHWRTSSAK